MDGFFKEYWLLEEWFTRPSGDLDAVRCITDSRRASTGLICVQN